MTSAVPDWKDKLVATGSDGASVNMGRHRSMTAFLKRDIPHLIPVHCANHRVELGALDAIRNRDAAIFADIKSLLRQLHKHYHYSAKAMRELKALAEAMEENVLKPANREGTRLMPHLSGALEKLLESYIVYVNHFEHIVEGRQGTADVQGRAKNILKHLKSEKLLHYMFFLRDVLSTLKDLSLEFQKDRCSIPDAVEAHQTACLSLVALQQRPGQHLQGFLDEYVDGSYKQVSLKRCEITDDQMNSKKRAFIEAVIDHISNTLGDFDTNDIFKAMQVFFTSNLPDNDDDLSTYGEEQVQTLCDFFASNLQRMGCQVLCVNVGFSCMARIKSDRRATLDPVMLNNLMAISISGPDFDNYNAERAVARWFHGGARKRRPQFTSDINN